MYAADGDWKIHASFDNYFQNVYEGADKVYIIAYGQMYNPNNGTYNKPKGEVFVHKNVRRMRIFVYALISVSLLFELQQWGIYHDLASQVRLEGYEVLPYSFKYAWFNYMLLALFTEIFAIGVKIKEEQDLTV